MKKSLILLVTFLLGTLSATAQAQNYYVCDNGNDSNDGRTEAKPFKSYEKAMDTFNKMSAGDSVLFCRGAVFPATSKKYLFNSSCKADNVCTIGDYGNENLPRPIINAVVDTGFNFMNGGKSKPDGGYLIENITLISKLHKGVGISLFNEVNDLTVNNVHIEGYRIGFHAAGANQPELGSNQANDRIVLKNSTIIKNSKQGWLGGCNDCLIENNIFENNGFATAILDHNVYISSPNQVQSFYNKNIIFRNNTLLNSTRVNGMCRGASLVVHGIIRDLTIENNTIREEVGKVNDHCWGIAVDPGNNLDESFIGLKIVKNKLFNVGNLGIGCASCKDVLISKNLIVDEGNVLRTGIAVPNKPEDTLKSENIEISDNKIVLNHEHGAGIHLAGANVFTALRNEISLSETVTRGECIKRSDANITTAISNNSCNSHNKVSIIDEIIPPETDVVENTPEEPAQEQPVVTEPETEVVENTPEEPVQEQPVETEVVENTPEEPVQEQPVVTEPETEIVENTPEAPVQQEPVVTEPETEVVDSGNNTETTTSFERPSWANQRPTTSSNFTVDNLIESMQNDYSNVSESECRVFARGKCLIR